MNLIMKLKNQVTDYAAKSPKTPLRPGLNLITKPLGYLPKLEFSKFDGSNCRMWNKKCSKYFHLCKIAEDQRVDLASLFMTHKAEKWVTSYLSVRKNLGWTEFVIDVSDRFKADRAMNVIEKFNKLQRN